MGAAAAAPTILSAAGLALFHHVLYGFFDPRRVYGPRPELSLRALPEGLLGLLLDQEFGLLAYAPVFALALPGLVRLGRELRRETVAAAALALGVALTAASWHMWRGGWNPPGRFLLPILPVLAVGLAARLRDGLGAGAALLAAFGLFTGLSGAAEPRLVHRDRDGTAPLFRAVSGAEEWTRLLPGFVLAEEEPDRHRLALVWAGALALAAAPRGPASARSLAAASLGLLCAAGLASRLSDAKTAGRDAARLVGRPAVAVPGFRLVSAAEGQWGPDALSWGPPYEPHRHPGGAVVGERLRLGRGRYILTLEAETLGGPASPPRLEVEGGGSRALVLLKPVPAGWRGAFDVVDEAEVTLRLRDGGPFVLRGINLSRPPRSNRGEMGALGEE
jgi:hypothetical protein